MSEIETRKLTLVKSIFLHGCDHSYREDPISRMLAVHHFDFAIEMMLKCIAEELSLSMRRKNNKYPDFPALIDEIEKKLSKVGYHLPRDKLLCVRSLRNSIQHEGRIPSKEDVILCKEYTREFLERTVSDIFHISWDKISLSLLIKNKKLRKIMKNAEKFLEEGNYREAIEACGDALQEAVFDEGRIFRKAGQLTHFFGAREEFKKVISEEYAEKHRNSELCELVRDLSRTILQLAQASTGMQFFEGFRGRFLQFVELMYEIEKIPPDQLEKYAIFSYGFVLDLILKWQEEGILPSEQLLK